MKNDSKTLAKALDRLSQIDDPWLAHSLRRHGEGIVLLPLPLGREVVALRGAFDEALDEVHYAGACSRVGRCMRLLIVENGQWAGGIVLGSTFPNIDVRDEALGLKRHVRNHHLRGLRSPWARENVPYWSRLQLVVNHART
jgi:hypothetical protein